MLRQFACRFAIAVRRAEGALPGAMFSGIRPPRRGGRERRIVGAMFKKLYAWTIALADSPHAPWALAAVAFAESSFFPIPPDIVLVPMTLAQPKRAWFYAGICTVASVLGGMVGYLIGALLYDTVGQWLIGLYGGAAKVESVREAYARWGAIFILVKGVTPIPYKFVTIVSGALGYSFALFVFLSIVTRGARFFIVAGLLNRWGEPIKAWLEEHFGLFIAVLVASIVAGFFIAARLM
jgi:membrane protein YqaA with SNARE-associated domain